MADYNTSAVPDGVTQGLDQISRDYQNGKIADSIVRINPEMLQMLNMPKEQFGSMSAQDRSSAVMGAITGIGIKVKQAQSQALQQRMAAQAADSQAQAAQRQQQAEDDAATGRAANRFAHPPTRQITPGIYVPVNPAPTQPIQPADGFGMSLSPGAQATLPQPGSGAAPAALSPDAAATLPTMQDRYNAALSTPGIGGRNLAPLLKQLGMMAPAYSETPGGTPMQFDEDPVTGARFARNGKVSLASGTDPAFVQPKAAQLSDVFNKGMDAVSAKIASAQEDLQMSDDELAAKNAATPPAQQRVLAAAKLRIAQQTGKASVDRLFTSRKIDGDQRDEFYDQLGLTGATQAATGTVPVVKSQADYLALKRGTQYQDAKGQKYTKK